MKLSELLLGLPVVSVGGDTSVDVVSVTADSRQCEKGSLFVAIPGLTRDGTEFIEGAVGRGAVAIVSEHESKALDAAWIVTRDAREACSLLSARIRGNPGDRLTLIGVTGTSGKTTTTRMIESVIDATGEPAGLIGTIEYRAGKVREIADRTTPDSTVLQEWLAKMVEAGVRIGVMEVSSHALALKRTFGLSFRVAVFTNLSRDHFDFHTDFEDYFSAKKILFEQLDRERGKAVVNVDDVYGRRLADELGERVLTFGRESGAGVHPGEGFTISIDGLSGEVITPVGAVRVRSPLIGLPNLYNWLAAIGAAVEAGIPIDAIERGITNLGSVRGRFERVDSPVGPTVIVDYAHKPDALEKLLHAVRDLVPGRPVMLVFGCGGDRDQGKRELMGEIAGRLATRSIITSDNPRGENPEAILSAIERGLKSVEGSSYEIVPDRREAIGRAIGEAGAETVVVIAGKGHENYQVAGDRIIHFDDREEAQSALKKLRRNEAENKL